MNQISINITIVILLLISSCTSIKDKPQLQLSTYTYDFGIIKKDTSYTGSVVLTNIGNSSLHIEDISAGCSCTKSTLSNCDIQPGDTSLLTFTYNSLGKKGMQENYIILKANTDSLIYVLQINANIK